MKIVPFTFRILLLIACLQVITSCKENTSNPAQSDISNVVQKKVTLVKEDVSNLTKEEEVSTID